MALLTKFLSGGTLKTVDVFTASMLANTTGVVATITPAAGEYALIVHQNGASDFTVSIGGSTVYDSSVDGAELVDMVFTGGAGEQIVFTKTGTSSTATSVACYVLARA